MNRQQAVQTDKAQKRYLEANKIRPMFSTLVKQLLLRKPEDPIQYLISFLDKNQRKLLICLQGYDDEERKRLAKIVTNKFNFKLIEVSQIFGNKDYHTQSDDVINEKVVSALKACESIYKGILISGYPNNTSQINFIQKSGYLPDRYFVLPFDEAITRQRLKKSYDQEDVNYVIKRNHMQNKQLLEGLGESIDFLPINVDAAAAKLTSTLGLKINKKSLPYDSPRVVLIHPPYLVPPNIAVLAEKYSLHQISIQKSLSKLIKKQSFKDYVQKHIRKAGSLTKEIELALIQTECKSAVAKNKGFILSGWPLKKQNLPFLKERYLSPHLIFIFDLDSLSCEQKFLHLQEGDPEVFPINQKPSLENYRVQVQNFQRLVENLKENESVQVLPWNQSQKQVLKTFESLIQNSKVYS